MMDNRDPFIYKTTDFGKTWTKISGKLPAPIRSTYVMAVAENPNRRGMLFAGTGHAFYYSMDDGAHWRPFQSGLPPAPVTWIVVEKRTHDRRRVDLWPRPVRPAGHHAAGTDGSDSGSLDHRALSAGRRVSHGTRGSHRFHVPRSRPTRRHLPPSRSSTRRVTSSAKWMWSAMPA